MGTFEYATVFFGDLSGHRVYQDRLGALRDVSVQGNTEEKLASRETGGSPGGECSVGIGFRITAFVAKITKRSIGPGICRCTIDVIIPEYKI